MDFYEEMALNGMMPPMPEMMMGAPMPSMMMPEMMGAQMPPMMMPEMMMGAQMPPMMMPEMMMGAQMPPMMMPEMVMAPGMMPCMMMPQMMPCMPHHHHHHPMQHMEHQQHCPCGMEEPIYEEPDHHHMEHHDYLHALNEAYPDLPAPAKEILRRLMAIDFTIIEFNLYLDTHPTDARALAQFNRYIAMRDPLVRRLEEMYGPLTPTQRSRYPWAWLNQPWPWRIEF